MYAEELFFTPKYVKAKEMADQGAFGKVYLVKQSEKHFGPHAAWFWDVRALGRRRLHGHGLPRHRLLPTGSSTAPRSKASTARWAPTSTATRPKARTTAICIIEFENDAVGLIEDSWAKRGGMDDRIEVYGSEGVSYAQPAHGQRPADLQRIRLRLRRREGPDHEGLELPGLRGAVELRLPAGDAPLRPLRARQGEARKPPAKTAAS